MYRKMLQMFYAASNMSIADEFTLYANDFS